MRGRIITLNLRLDTSDLNNSFHFMKFLFIISFHGTKNTSIV